MRLSTCTFIMAVEYTQLSHRMLGQGSNRKKRNDGSPSPNKATCASSSSTLKLSPAANKGESQLSLSATDTALSNVLILQEIFSNLIYEDLLSCSNVHSFWHSVVDPMICYYRITFDAQSLRTGEELNVEVEEIIGSAPIAQNSRIIFRLLMEKLRNNPKRHFMSIELRLCGILTKYYLPLLTEFGERVHVLDCEYNQRSFHIVSFFTNIYYFPNLQVLKCNGARLKCANFPDHDLVLPRLRRIYMGKTVPIEHWTNLLRIAPNVEELLEFPVQCMIKYPPLVKPNVFKSILYMGPFRDFLLNKRNLSDLATSLGVLADLSVALTSVAIPNFHFLMPESKHLDRCWEPWVKVDTGAIQGNIRRILRSSKDTVKELTIPSAKRFGYDLPVDFQMVSVKVLRFEDDSAYEHKAQNYFKNECYPRNLVTKWAEEHHYCPRNTDLASMFPSLEAVEIKFNVLKRNFIRFFPRDTFGPKILGSRVKKLKIKGASPECFEAIVKIFPYVTRFEMESTVEHFSLVFPIVSKAWPYLKSWTVLFDPMKSFHPGRRKYCSLDPVLTGIPDELCMKINRRAHPHEKGFVDKIRMLQGESRSLLNMTNLERLEFIINGEDFFCHCNCKHKPSFISAVSGNFAFLHMPDLTVIVRMRKGLNAFGELRSAMEPVMNFIQLDNRYSAPR